MRETPSLDLLGPAEAAQRMRRALGELSAPLFAVLDGGMHDDLPGFLQQQGIHAQSLFRQETAADVIRAGPWLVALADVLKQGIVERLDAEHACAVYWSCGLPEEDVRRHLRSINEIIIPVEQPDGTFSQAFERVLFRHWDPNVLGAVLPLLTNEQLSRFLGPADAVIFNAPDYGGLKRARATIDMPAAPPGPLRFEPDQMVRLKAVMLHSSRLRIARFLKGNVPAHFSGVDDSFIWGATLASETSADELGIKTERGRARWAYVMMMSDGKAANAPEVRNYIRDGGDTPDNRVKSLIQHTVDALRSNPSLTGGAA
ncbi:DUF4123 domain-containing protein [Rhizobium helianthi]|uniref:DUF4123 domain-containing protein n=1 Tax=Rhizobium helianthi TaxID=1132695 RepID=A0ABW4MA80_9HYPH